MIAWIYDRFGNQVDCIGDFIEFVHDDEIGALDFVEFTIQGDRLSKGQYIVWRDGFQAWHEHRVESVEVRHAQGSVYQHVYADNSITDLATFYINERNAYDCMAVEAIRILFDGITLWEIGKVDIVTGNQSHKFYHCTAYEGLVDVIDTWGGEISTEINVDRYGVSRRRLNYTSRRGQDNGLVFTYGFDADNITRKEDLDEVYTLLHCFGKGEEQLDEEGQGTGIYSRRITFADINDGKDYVTNEEALDKWGMPDGKGGKRHSEGWYIWEEVTDKEELLKLGKAMVKEVSQPRITYTANVVILADAGMDFKNARAGDTVYIRDEPLDERLNGRVLHVRRYLDESRPTEITLGNVVRTLSNVIKDQQSSLDSINRRSSSWDAAAAADGKWLDKMMDNLNDMMNATGGYVYWRQGDGITIYDKPEDQNPTMAIQLKGAGFRIANKKKSNGEWDWRTFGTGDGFTADEIIAGVIRGGESYWNLVSGYMETHKMKAYDIEATGSFTCSSGNTTMVLSNGQLSGKMNGNNSGFIQYALNWTNNQTGTVMYGPEVFGPGIIGLVTPMLATVRSSNYAASSYGTLEGTASIPNTTYTLSGEGVLSSSTNYSTLTFHNGLLSNISGASFTSGA